MPTIAEVRQKFPQYDDLSDDQLAGALHQKFYSDMPAEEFYAKVGLALPQRRIAGAFEAAQPVRQVAKLVEPFKGGVLPVSRNRFGDVSYMDMTAGLPGMVVDAAKTVNRAGEALRGKGDPSQAIDAMIGLGALGTTINPAYRAGARAIPGELRAARPKQVPPVPTREELYKVGDAGYEQARRMGVDYDPNFIADLAAQTQAALDRDGFNIRTARNTFSVLRDLQRIPKTGSGERAVVQLDDLHTARKQLRRIPKGPDFDQDREAARRVIDRLDRFSEDPPAPSVMARPADVERAERRAVGGVFSDNAGAGPGEVRQQAQQIAQERARQAGAIQKEARGNWAAMERSKEVAGRQQSAERRAKANNSGFNIDNTLRQRVASLLDEVDKGRIKGFSAEEIKAMNEFAVGTPTRNSVRLVANILGGGGGMATLLAAGIAGAAGGYPAALALPAAGISAKMTQNALGRRAMTKLDEQVRTRSPLYQERLAAAPIKPLSRMKPAIGLRAAGALGPVNPLTIYLSGGEERDRLLGDPRYQR